MGVEKTHFWKEQGLYGVELMTASLQSHDYSPHVHDGFVLAVTEEGSSWFNSRGVREFAATDRVLIFNPDEPHSGNMKDCTHWNYRAFYINWEAVCHLCEDIEIQPKDFPYFLTNVIDDPCLSNTLRLAHSFIQNSLNIYDSKVVFIEALDRLFSYGVKKKNLDIFALGGDSQKKISYISEFIKENCDKNLSITCLAKECGMPAYSLMRNFKKRRGLTVHAYLMQCRLHKARALLRDGVSIAEAGYQSGFYDQSKLTKYFKSSYAITPKKYQQSVCPFPTAGSLQSKQ